LDGSSLLDQHEKGSLEGVVGVVRVEEDPATHSQHHRPMAADEDFEGCFILSGDEALQKLPIGHPPAVLQEGYSAKVVENTA
jgi:hypothetical protein